MPSRRRRGADRRPVRTLALVLGDQLDAKGAALRGLDPERDAVLMLELEEEATHAPAHARKLVLFFSAMRHRRDALRERGWRVEYGEIGEPGSAGGFAEALPERLRRLRPETLVVARPGDRRVEDAVRRGAKAADAPLQIVGEEHFLASPDFFAEFAEGRRRLLMEDFYRRLRREQGVLVDARGRPEGGRWNFDAENREAFGREGPPRVKAPRSFRPDATTRAVMREVARRFPGAPGSVEGFDHPVTRAQARAALRDVVRHRLAGFGPHQDAMAAGHPHLFHSRLSSALNLHLLAPREVVDAAVAAYEAGEAPLASVEGFVRQVLGWREFVRGVYDHAMPEYAERNALGAELPLPGAYWSGETEMRCVRECVTQMRELAYAHHIQRLMVLGLYALLLGVHPLALHRWHMGLAIDAVDWASLPNVLGMSQHADGGVVGTKPYCASGAYVRRMSDYCRGCRYDPGEAEGERACPLTALYWDFLARHRRRWEENPRMGFQMKNLARKPRAELRRIRRRAEAYREEATA